MRMEALVTSCIYFALIACPLANAQQLAPAGGYTQQPAGRFVRLTPTTSGRQESTFGASIVPVGLVESAAAVPLVPLDGTSGEISRLPGPAAPQTEPVIEAHASNPISDFGDPAMIPATETTWMLPQHPLSAQEVAFGADQKQDGVACGKDCKGKCCCPPAWAHRTGVFGEFLFLRSRDSEIAYALPVNGTIPIGPVGVLDQDFSTGFRAGFSVALDECTSLVATYSQLESSTYNFVETDPTPALRALLLHPATNNAASDFLSAGANYDVDFQLVDADYRSLLFGGDCYAVNYSIGARFANLEQNLQADYSLAGSTETVVTDIDFDGAGIRLGLDAERHTNHHGFLCYGKAFTSFVGGEFRADYDHSSTTDPSIVDTAWKAGRVVTMLDLEVGVGWQSPCGHYRLTTGYMFSTWLNTVNTDTWIESVQGNNFVGLEDRMTFDGLTARAELRF